MMADTQKITYKFVNTDNSEDKFSEATAANKQTQTEVDDEDYSELIHEKANVLEYRIIKIRDMAHHKINILIDNLYNNFIYYTQNEHYTSSELDDIVDKYEKEINNLVNIKGMNELIDYHKR